MASLFRQDRQKSNLWDKLENTLISAAINKGVGAVFGDVSQREQLAIRQSNIRASEQAGGVASALTALSENNKSISNIEELFLFDPEKAEQHLLDLTADIEAYTGGEYTYTDSSIVDANGNFVQRRGVDENLSVLARESMDYLNTKIPVMREKGKIVSDHRILKEDIDKAQDKIKSGFYGQSDLKDVIDKMKDNQTERLELGMTPLNLNQDILDARSWNQASSMAFNLDADPDRALLQLGKGVLEDAPLPWGLDNENLDKNQVNTMQAQVSKYVQDMRSENIIDNWAGQSDITYGDAAKMVDIYLKSNRPIQAMALMDRMVPDTKGLKQQKEEIQIRTALESYGLNANKGLVTTYQNYIATAKGAYESIHDSNIKATNTMQIKFTDMDRALLNDAKLFYGLNLSGLGTIEDFSTQPVVNIFNQDTGDAENKMSDNVRDLFGSYFAALTPIKTATKNESTPMATRVPMVERRLVDSGRAYMKLLASGYSGDNDGKGDKIQAVIGFQVTQDAEGNTRREPVYETINYDRIDTLTEDQILMTLGHDKSTGGLKYYLGLDLDPDEYTESQIQKESVKRTSQMYLGSDFDAFVITDRKTNFTSQALEGAEANLLRKMGRHWIETFNDYGKMRAGAGEMAESSKQLEELQKFIGQAQFGKLNLLSLSPNMRSVVTQLGKVSELNSGNAKAVDGENGESIQTDLTNIFKRGSKIVDETLGKSDLYGKINTEIQRKLATIQEGVAGYGAGEKFDWVGAYLGGKVTPEEYDFASKEIKDLPSSNVLRSPGDESPESESLDKLAADSDIQELSADIEGTKISGADTSGVSTVPDSVSISLDPNQDINNALNQVETSGNLMDLTNEMASGIDTKGLVPDVEPLQDKKEPKTREDLVNMELVDSTGQNIDFNNPAKFKKQISGIVAKIKSLNKTIGSSATQKNRKSLVMEAKYWLDVLKNLNINVKSLGDQMEYPSTTGFSTTRDTRAWKETMSEISGLLPHLEETSKWMY